MIELIKLYIWILPVGVFFAITLSLLGIQLSAQKKSMQSFAMSQGAMLAVIIGILLDWHSHLLVFIGTYFAYLLSEFLGKNDKVSGQILNASLFIFFLSVAYLITALFPQLETHMSSVFFGDLATLSQSHAKVLTPIAILGSVIMVVYRKNILNFSFEIALFGKSFSELNQNRNLRFAYQVLVLFFVSLSVQDLGFLFTVAFLFLPALSFNFSRPCNLNYLYIRLAVLACLSSLLGFLISLSYPSLPTVPAIVLCFVCFAVLMYFIDFIKEKIVS